MGRFDADSGFDILAEALTPILERGVELVLMGPRSVRRSSRRLRTIEQTFVGRCRVVEGYDVSTAHTLLAGADMLLLPGHYHATNALSAISMRYGVVPARIRAQRARGHARRPDRVPQERAQASSSTPTTRRRSSTPSTVAATLYKKATDWKTIAQVAAWKQDFSWAESGREYHEGLSEASDG